MQIKNPGMCHAMILVQSRSDSVNAVGVQVNQLSAGVNLRRREAVRDTGVRFCFLYGDGCATEVSTC